MSEKRYCKKCGRELASINDGEVCQHCRREKGKLLTIIGGAVITVGMIVGAVYKIIK